MQRWEERQRQKAHGLMVNQAKPTIKRYSRSRENQGMNQIRSNSVHTHINMPFRQVLTMFQLQKYEQMLLNQGFPEKIKEKDSVKSIDAMLKTVDERDQERFYSLMNSLLTISKDNKPVPVKRTPPIRKKKLAHLPPTTLSSNLKKCDSLATRKHDRSTSFRIKTKSNVKGMSIHDAPTPPPEKTVVKRAKAHDDSSIVHEYGRGKKTVKMINKSNSIIRRIEERIKGLKGQEKAEPSPSEVKLYYKEIRDMYMSYDSATLTSNIANIDIDQIIDCFAIQLHQKIVAQSSIPLNPQHPLDRKEQQRVQTLLKESLLQPEARQQQLDQDQVGDQVDETISRGSSSSSDLTSCPSQQFWDFNKQSMASDLSHFNYQYADLLPDVPSRIDIKNFIQLVMMAGKMEKQIPILAYAYIIRLLSICKHDAITPYNWKNIVLITLIEASKVWDDQSLENHSFSKVIKPYTTLEINRLERHLLTLLRYELKIEAKQYCESYFNLRKHAGSSAKTVHLMPLNLQTIKKLQSGTKKCEKNMKQTYSRKLNESF